MLVCISPPRIPNVFYSTPKYTSYQLPDILHINYLVVVYLMHTMPVNPYMCSFNILKLCCRSGRSFQWAGGFVLLLVSAWFVDMFIMFGRALRFIRRRFLHGARSEGEKFMLPLWAFPLMWFVTFLTLVSVASVQGAKDPVVRTVEVTSLFFLCFYFFGCLHCFHTWGR